MEDDGRVTYVGESAQSAEADQCKRPRRELANRFPRDLSDERR